MNRERSIVIGNWYSVFRLWTSIVKNQSIYFSHPLKVWSLAMATTVNRKVRGRMASRWSQQLLDAGVQSLRFFLFSHQTTIPMWSKSSTLEKSTFLSSIIHQDEGIDSAVKTPFPSIGIRGQHVSFHLSQFPSISDQMQRFNMKGTCEGYSMTSNR